MKKCHQHDPPQLHLRRSTLLLFLIDMEDPCLSRLTGSLVTANTLLAELPPNHGEEAAAPPEKHRRVTDKSLLIYHGSSAGSFRRAVHTLGMILL